MEIKI